MSTALLCDWPDCREPARFSVSVYTLVDEIGIRPHIPGTPSPDSGKDLDMCRKHFGTVEVMAWGGVRFPLPRQRFVPV